ncbi:MAG: hypothetical protein IPL33_15295 [Sphingobacteriales bacterium]|nr:hypothetical protein [Sphingobacteriales bacterium]
MAASAREAKQIGKENMGGSATQKTNKKYHPATLISKHCRVFCGENTLFTYSHQGTASTERQSFAADWASVDMC